MIFRKIVNPLAPINAAASSSSFPCEFKIGMISLDTNGKVTKMVAKMTPGIANAIRIFVPKKVLIARIAGYVHPSLPNVIKNARPTITGEMENGISIKVAKTCFPLKLNLVNKNAAMIPKNVLIDTATSVARIVTNKALLTYSVDMELT